MRTAAAMPSRPRPRNELVFGLPSKAALYPPMSAGAVSTFPPPSISGSGGPSGMLSQWQVARAVDIGRRNDRAPGPITSDTFVIDSASRTEETVGSFWLGQGQHVRGRHRYRTRRRAAVPWRDCRR